jgi:hypothetical protein
MTAEGGGIDEDTQALLPAAGSAPEVDSPALSEVEGQARNDHKGGHMPGDDTRQCTYMMSGQIGGCIPV